MVGAGSVAAVFRKEPRGSSWLTARVHNQHRGSQWLGMGPATQPAPRAGHRAHTLHLLSQMFYFPSLTTGQAEGCKRWEILQWGAGCCHRSNTSQPQPGEPVGRRMACVPVPVCWWQQLIPSCSSGGDCFGLVGCIRKCGCHRSGPVDQGLCPWTEHCWCREGLDPLCCR